MVGGSVLEPSHSGEIVAFVPPEWAESQASDFPRWDAVCPGWREGRLAVVKLDTPQRPMSFGSAAREGVTREEWEAWPKSFLVVTPEGCLVREPFALAGGGL
jgi:hypothetical protein